LALYGTTGGRRPPFDFEFPMLVFFPPVFFFIEALMTLEAYD
jgi:hypothetical protein